MGIHDEHEVREDGNGSLQFGEEVEVEVESRKPQDKEKIVFPPPASWYKSSIASSRDHMWAYCATGVIVLVYPPNPYPAGSGSDGVPVPVNVMDQDQDWRKKTKPNDKSRWPKFELMGTQLEKYSGISFCQTPWDYLPVKGAPLVSGCEKGFVRVWNLERKETVIYHDNHAGNPVVGLDWSSVDHSTIFSIDDKGIMSVWNVTKNSLRSLNFGKIQPTCLNASPHDKDVVCFGTKGGNVFVVSVSGTTGKILAKVRHDEEVVITSWMPKGEWRVSKNMQNNSKLPLLVSNVHSTKLPTIRIWSQGGDDVGTLQCWERDNKQRPFKMFGNAAWAKDPNSGDLMLISSDRHGSLVGWSSGQAGDFLHRVHSHNAIYSIVQCGDVLWSLSYEPVIVGWNLRSHEVECVIPTFKGVCTMSPSPVDPSRLAIGGTDSHIRVLKCVPGYPTTGDTCTKAPVVTHRLKGKVTAIAWHPTRDNFIGFGTDEGVVGVYELKENNKNTMTMDRRVTGTVYTVTFGPAVYAEDYVKPKHPSEANGVEDVASMTGSKKPSSDGEQVETGSKRSGKEGKEPFVLYACGGNSVFLVHPSKPSNPLTNVGKIIDKTNPVCIGGSVRMTDKVNEICWSPDYSLFAVGYGDGGIELFEPPHLKLRCWIKCHLRAIQFLAWRPFDFGPERQADTCWLASASNDGTTRLYNLAPLFDESEKERTEPLMLISSEATLKGHGIRVISCAFSPHDSNLLVTVAYDCTAIVWNVAEGIHVARYIEHLHRLVACSFHPCDPYKVISVSDDQSSDFSFHVWDYREHPFRLSAPRTPGCKPSHPIKAACETIRSLPEAGSVTENVAIKECGDKIYPGKASGSTSSSATRKPHLKSLLSLTSNSLINAKHSLAKELVFLSETPPELSSLPSVEDPSVYLGILGSAADATKQLLIERKEHDAKKHTDQSAILSTWISDPSWVEEAIKNRQVNETVLVTAGFFSKKLYVEALNIYVEQLTDNEEYIRASHLCLVLGQPDKAVKILVDNACYRDAVALIKAQLPENSALFSEVASKWALQAVRDGNFELATKLYFSIGQYGNALVSIEKRDLPYAYEAGCFISSKLGDEKKLEVFGSKFIMDGIIRGAYEDCYKLITEYPALRWLTAMIMVHEALKKYAEFAASIKTADDYKQWKLKVASVIKEVRMDYVAQLDGHVLDEDEKKICSNILVSIAQNENDAQQIIIKNLALLIMGFRDHAQVWPKATEVIKLATTWFEKTNVFMYFSCVIVTWFIVTDYSYSTPDTLPEYFKIAQNHALAHVKPDGVEEDEDKNIPTHIPPNKEENGICCSQGGSIQDTNPTCGLCGGQLDTSDLCL